jgi:hypothetical protein
VTSLAARIVGERFVHSQRRQNPGGRVPLTDHLRELRNCVVTMALALAGGMASGPSSSADLARHRAPAVLAAIRGHSGCPALEVDRLVLDGPLDVFSPRVKVVLVVG